MSIVYKVPQNNLPRLKTHWRLDMLAGAWVFMFSLSMSLALAAAAGFPIFAGCIAAIVGGLLVNVLSSSPLAVKASGLSTIPILLLAVDNLSYYPQTGIQYTLAVIVLAGVFQVILGILRVGSWQSVVPDAVIFGVITAAAIHIFAHQVHTLVGASPQNHQAFWLLLEIPNSLWNLQPAVALVGGISLFILFAPSLFRTRWDNSVPFQFIILLIGVAMGFYVGLPELSDKKYLLNPPHDYWQIFTFPDFTKLITWQSINYALFIALMGMLESLLNNKTIEVLDIYRRKSLPNQEVILLGLGNIVSGLLGGMPMIITLATSSLNVNSHAKTRWGAIFGSFFMLLSIVLFWNFFQYIPLATLAALLIYTTYRLNSLQLFRSIREIGIDQFIIFILTIVISLIFGWLAGLVGGIITTFMGYVFLGSPLKSIFRTHVEVNKRSKNRLKIDICDSALASNYFSLQKYLRNIAPNERVIIDLAKTKVVDHNFLEQIYYFAHTNDLNDGRIELQGLKNHIAISSHPLATLRLDKNPQNQNRRLTIDLDERQIDLQAVAAVNNAKFESNLTYDGIVLQGFAFTFGYEVRYRENKFMKFYNSNMLEFSDVFLTRGIRMSEMSYKMSVLLITVLELPIPDFTLTKEDLMDKFFQSLGYEDIDFEAYPSFSETYLLQGENPTKIRTMFTAELLEHIQHHPFYCLEAKNNRLLLYQSKSLMDKVDLEDAIAFVEQFLDIVYEEKLKLG
ncbi:MAG: SulP family inorganic anion transporter [Microscillaceae bacterium]|jgi:MFS superfamily sulfate permease-like transporter|nr:SulP family inorganic anion transporter [Microscillaceae bacterium]